MAANPNTLSPDNPKYWSRRMQVKRSKETVYQDLASFAEEVTLKKGSVVDRPYRSALTVNTLGGDGAYTRQALVDTSETLTVNIEKEISIYIKETDEIQNNYKIANEYIDDGSKRAGEQMDGDFLGEATNASSVVGAYEIAGTGSAGDGLGFTLTISNIEKVFAIARRKLKRKHISTINRWAVISPEFEEVLYQYLAGKESALGDKVGTNPNEIGMRGGFRLFVSESNLWTAELVMSDVAVANDTLVINGVTFTAKASPAAAGEFDVEASASAQGDTIVAMLTNSSGYAASAGDANDYIEVTAANRALLTGISAVNVSGTVTIRGEGAGFWAVSETLTNGAFTTAKQIQHNLFGQGKPVDMVVQKYPKVKPVPRTGYVGMDYVIWWLYGIKSFLEGRDAMVDVLVRSESFV